MCRMMAAPLGIAANNLVPSFVRMAKGLNTLSELNRELGAYTHGHGWGAIIDSHGMDHCHRSVKACWDDDAIDDLGAERVLLLHARMASKGAINLDNVHPFQVSTGEARWTFCHNGTVRDVLVAPPTLRTTDCTDSEIVFHHLLPHLNTSQVLEGIRVVYGAIHDFTSLNTLLLGPDALWVVCLYTRTPGYFTLYLTETLDFGPIVSSEPLVEFNGQQTPMQNGQILQIDRSSGAIRRHTL